MHQNGSKSKFVEKNCDQVTIVANSLVETLWPQIVPLLLLGKEYWEDYYELHHFKEKLIAGQMQLWVRVDENTIPMILITEIIIYPKAKFLRYYYMGGKGLRAVLRYRKKVEDWAKGHGAVGYEIGAFRFSWLAVDKKQKESQKHFLFVTGKF